LRQACRSARPDQLQVHPHPIAAALHAAFEHIAHVQFAVDLLHISGLALECECSVARDDESAGDPRKVGGQALSDAVSEIVLFGVAAGWRRAAR
jgi:hypothetical protein